MADSDPPADVICEPDAGAAAVDEPKCGGRIRARVPILIMVMQAVMIWWIADSEIARGIYLICYSLMMPTVLYLLLSRALRWLFEENELLLGYIVLTATIPIVGFGGLRFLIEGMGWLPFLSQTQAQWTRHIPFVDRLPVLHDHAAIQDLYRGGSGVPWQAWVTPIAFWSVYLLLLSGMWICLAGILRRIWIDQERLSFPVAMLPLRMTDPHERIFHKPVFWIGFGIPVVLQSLLVFHQWAPSLPAVQLKAFDMKPMLFTSPPWDAIPNLPVGFYPMAIGLAYFVPSDVSFSCWFLALAMRLVYVVAASFGVESAGIGAARFPYREEQAAGAWLALAGLILWGARRHWATVISMVPRAELRGVRWMIAAAAACSVLCALMMAAVGIPLIGAAVVMAVYIAYALSGARVRAEAGAQWTFAPLIWTPHRVTTSLFGTQAMDPTALTAGGTFNLIHVDIRAQSLPYLMEGLNIAEKSGIPWRRVMVLVGTFTVIALAIGWWSTLDKLYDIGAATAKADGYAMRKVEISYNEIHRLSASTGAWDSEGIAAMAAGGAITLLLAASRRLGPFGLHPIGYVLCNTLTMSSFIMPFFLAWLAKTVALRFGGNRAYRSSVPFFVGVVLGDIMIQATWALVGAVFEAPIYQFLT